MKNNVILNEVSKIIIPIIQLFSIYVILFGHISPGGGFAGGTLLGNSYIISYLVYGKEYMNKKLNINFMLKIMSICLITYGIIKLYSFLTAGTHLPHLPKGVPGNILSGGFILPLNILVGITVAYVMYLIFSLFMRN